MNFSNKLTVSRMAVAPFFLFSLMTKKFLCALFLFVFAVLTDFFDGKIARSTNQVTDFGKFLDPIADKVLTTMAFLYLLKVNVFDIVPVSIIFSREFMVSAVRLVACRRGLVLPAGFYGKVKTFFQMVSIIFGISHLFLKDNFCLLGKKLSYILILSHVFLWVSILFSIISCFKYFFVVRRSRVES